MSQTRLFDRLFPARFAYKGHSQKRTANSYE